MKIEKKAYAKLNLGLDITGRREDGYHLVRMIMQTIDLYDVLTFEKTAEPGVTLSLSEDSTIPDAVRMPLDERNLIVKAARKMMEGYGITEGVSITLVKDIPMEAGMAGGSTDCAATLRGIAELFELPVSEEELREIGVTLGADVPYCIMGGTALSEGIGEILTPLTPLPDCRFIIIKPSFGASTKEVYGAYDCLPPEEIRHPDIDGMVQALRQKDLTGVMNRLGNVLEQVTVEMHPEIRVIEEILRDEGVSATIMTGSGPTVFGMYPEGKGIRSDLLTFKEKLRNRGITAGIYLV
ncbi:MAG: 4-(cytidine 5'-diphospho)-2-C-methyl-D-erythritol kinase [Eubacterium sp.]|nr:4-(cytidine 5'-diphospho)-2-C-methyl-D-erythritol kinase [Eubacterium sp.]